MEEAAPPSVLSPEQRFCGVSVGGSLEAVRFDPGDFAFEKRNPFLQFILRIRAEILGSELARGVAFGAWTIIVFHCFLTILFRPVAVNTPPR